jgi:hypothetical protein
MKEAKKYEKSFTNYFSKGLSKENSLKKSFK